MKGFAHLKASLNLANSNSQIEITASNEDFTFILSLDIQGYNNTINLKKYLFNLMDLKV